jgi:HEPN domain-containing protein
MADRSNSTIPQDWIKIAENDLKFATDSLSLHAEFLPQICFYFQQAAEKYLKAYIIAKKLPFAKIHSLPALLKTCQKSDESFSKLTSECKFLTEFYLEERYPSLAIPSEITQEIAQKAETAAKKVGEFVKGKVKLSGGL